MYPFMASIPHALKHHRLGLRLIASTSPLPLHPSWYRRLGITAEGRPIHGFEIGHGPQVASLVSGHHADEPIGSATLLALLMQLSDLHAHLSHGADSQAINTPTASCPVNKLLSSWTLLICPHAHPDGARKNDHWVRQWPSSRQPHS